MMVEEEARGDELPAARRACHRAANALWECRQRQDAARVELAAADAACAVAAAAGDIEALTPLAARLAALRYLIEYLEREHKAREAERDAARHERRLAARRAEEAERLRRRAREMARQRVREIDTLALSPPAKKMVVKGGHLVPDGLCEKDAAKRKARAEEREALIAEWVLTDEEIYPERYTQHRYVPQPSFKLRGWR